MPRPKDKQLRTIEEKIQDIKNKIGEIKYKHSLIYLELINKEARLIYSSDPLRAKKLTMEALGLARALKSDREGALALASLGGAQLYLADYQNALQNTTKAVELSRDIEYFEGQLYAQNILAIVLNRCDKPIEAIENLLEIHKLAFEKKDSHYISGSLNNIAFIFMTLKNPSKALQYFQHLRKYLEKTNDYSNLGVVLLNIAEAYLDLLEPDEAIKYLRKSEKYTKYSPLLSIEHYQVYSKYFETIFNMEKAVSYAELAVEKYREIGNKVRIGKASLRLAKLYWQMEKVNRAKDSFALTVKMCETTDEKKSWVEAINSLAQISLATSDVDKANKLLNEVLSKDDAGIDLSKTYQQLSEYYEKSDDCEHALKYYKLYFEAKKKAIEKDNYYDMGSFHLTPKIEEHLKMFPGN